MEANIIKTREIAEAAIYYLYELPMQCYLDKHWHFADAGKMKAKELRLELVNRKLKVEPLELMDAIRRVKAFSNEGKSIEGN